MAPELTAVEAPVIWLRDVEKAAIATHAEMPQFGQAGDFSLSQLRVRVHVHIDIGKRQIVTLENKSCRVTLIVDGAPMTTRPVALHIERSSISALADHIQRVNELAHLLIAKKYLGPFRGPGPSDAKHLRNALIAHDGEIAGASRREIASALYGSDVVNSDWSEPSGRLKAIVKRDVLRGRRLVSSGWRNLITAGTFRSDD